MAGAGSLATTAIITKGLTCGHAPLDPCKSGLITSAFSLYCTSTIIPPTVYGGGGGPYPRDAWNKYNPGDIKNFYQPVPEKYYIVPRDQEDQYFRRFTMVKITLKLGEYTSEKEFSVPERRAKIIAKAFDLLEVSRDRINVAVSSVKRITSEIVVAVKNIRLKK